MSEGECSEQAKVKLLQLRVSNLEKAVLWLANRVGSASAHIAQDHGEISGLEEFNEERDTIFKRVKDLIEG